MHIATKVFASTMVLGAGLMGANDADARTSYRTAVSATQACQATTPLNLGGLRFRPLGIYNASANPIYISCSLPIESGADVATVGEPATQQGMQMYINLKSSTGATSVDCTFANGSRVEGVAASFPVSIPLLANEAKYFHVPDMDRVDSWGSLNFTCLLPPDVELSGFDWYQYDLDGDSL